MRNDPFRGIHRHTTVVVQLSGLARLYRYTGIRIMGAVVCLVAQQACFFVGRADQSYRVIFQVLVVLLHALQLMLGSRDMYAGETVFAMSFFVVSPILFRCFLQVGRLWSLQAFSAPRFPWMRSPLSGPNPPLGCGRTPSRCRHISANTLLKSVLEKGCRIKLPCPADRRVPWQLLVQVIAQKIEHVHPHAAVFHQFSVRGDVLKVSGDQQLEEDYGIYRGVTCTCHIVPSYPCR